MRLFAPQPRGGAREVPWCSDFPRAYCNDGGRRINIGDPELADSRSEGFGKTAYNYFEKELRPLGYKLRAEIVSFPEGLPGRRWHISGVVGPRPFCLPRKPPDPLFEGAPACRPFRFFPASKDIKPSGSGMI